MLQRELTIAAGIQRNFLPADTSPCRQPGIDLHAIMIPARSVGGDFYDFFTLADGRFGLVIGDVSGKGLSAALLMTVSRTVVRTIALQGTPPGDCLAEVNRCLCRDNRTDLYVTVYYAVLDPRTGEVLTANAGHPPPFRVARQGTVSPVAPLDGLPLAFRDGAAYETEQTVLRDGDALVFYTDGVTEAGNPARRAVRRRSAGSEAPGSERAPAEVLVTGIVTRRAGFFRGRGAGGRPDGTGGEVWRSGLVSGEW